MQTGWPQRPSGGGGQMPQQQKLDQRPCIVSLQHLHTYIHLKGRAGRQAGRQAGKVASKLADRQEGRQTTDRQKHRQTDRQAGRQAERQTLLLPLSNAVVYLGCFTCDGIQLKHAHNGGRSMSMTAIQLL